MGRRSDFERVPHDLYRTIDPRAVRALAPHVAAGTRFAEPCVGQGDLVAGLAQFGLQCGWQSDVEFGFENLAEQHLAGLDLIISNPPWTRALLHQMIAHFSGLRPTWLLFDAPWMHTGQSAQFMRYCRAVVSVGRLIWIPGTTMSGKDDCAWYLFDRIHDGPTIFHGRREVENVV